MWFSVKMMYRYDNRILAFYKEENAVRKPMGQCHPNHTCA